MSRFDIVIFGATGYTGTFVVRELAQQARKENLTWAVAGRSTTRLAQVLKSIGTELKTDLSSIECIIVDTTNDESLRNMCQRAKLIINCVGPYRFHGEQVVRACVESGTHHIDVSGEPEYLERMHLKFNQQALENNVYIVGSCGFDSVPCDLGVIFTQREFKNDLNHIESYLTMDFGGADASFNFATWESAVYGFASAKDLGKIRKQLFKERLPKSNHPVPKRGNLFGYFFDKLSQKYCFPFMGSDKSVVQRTQYYNYEVLNQRPIQYSPYFTISTLFYTNMMIVFGLAFSLLANYKFGRYLLLKYYWLFSCGMASKKETKYEEMKNMKFTMQFRGAGFSKKVADKNSQIDEKPTHTITTEVSGPEPGYIGTAKILTECAIVLLKENANIAVRGGVLTPGAAFGNTSLINRLSNNGFSFKVVS